MHKWFSMKANGEKTADIYIYDQIGENWWGDGISAKRFAEDLKALGDLDTINLFINSPGGAVFDGQAIYSLLLNHKAKVNARIDGLAASIASVIVMAADTITMPDNALFMIHDPLTVAVGNENDMLKAVELLQKVKETALNAYQRKTSLDRTTIAQMMSDETWMTAQEAKANGFVDVVSESVPMAAIAHFDASKFQNVPPQLAALTSVARPAPASIEPENTAHIPVNQKGEPPVEITMQLLQEKAPDLLKDIQAQAKKEGAESERARIKGVSEQMLAGHDALVQELMYDGVTSPEQAALKIVAAEKALGKTTMQAIEADAPSAVKFTPVNAAKAEDKAAAIDPNLPLDARCKAEWETSKDLQNEFSSLEAYTAFCKADEKGLVKIKGRA